VRTVEKIEELVRRYARDTTITLSVSTGLDTLNAVYRRVCKMYKWPEFRNTLTSFTLSTVSGDGTYSWFVMDGGDSTTTSWTHEADGGDSTTTTWALEADDSGGASGWGEYYNIVSVEVETSATSDEYKMVLVPRSESEWNITAKDTNSIPTYYMRHDSGDENIIEFRPIPNYTGGKIKITGYLEPVPLLNESSTTIFLSSIPDAAISKLVAAEYLFNKGQYDKHKTYTIEAIDSLTKLTGKEKIPRGSNV
jgi:hypothetical protein